MASRSTDEDPIEASRQRFLKVTRVVDFLRLWAAFYRNEIYIPSYSLLFDNEQDTHAAAETGVGEKFYNITRHRFIANDFQTTEPGRQKGYITGYVPNGVAKLLDDKLNRYSGIVSWYSSIGVNHDDDFGYGPLVTVDVSDDEAERTQETGEMYGDSFSNCPMMDQGEFEGILEWLNPGMKIMMNPKNYKYVTIIAPDLDGPPYLVVDRLLEALRSMRTASGGTLAAW